LSRGVAAAESALTRYPVAPVSRMLQLSRGVAAAESGTALCATSMRLSRFN